MNRIRDFREDRDLTQKELASIVGVSTMTVMRWENGQTEVPALMAIKLSDVFKVPVEELFNMKSFIPKVLFKEIDNVYQYIITRLESLTNSELLRLQGAVESLLYNRNSNVGIPAYQKPEERGVGKKGN